MKKVSLFILGLAFIGSMMSCKKCIECSVTVNGVTSTSEEYCEKKKDREDAEDKFMEGCEALKAIDPSTKCECKDK